MLMLMAAVDHFLSKTGGVEGDRDRGRAEG